jgi:hypothetical protein
VLWSQDAPRSAVAIFELRYGLAQVVPGHGIVFEDTSRVTIAGPTSNATRRVVGQWGGAGGAICEDHLGGREAGVRVALSILLLVSFASVLQDAS